MSPSKTTPKRATRASRRAVEDIATAPSQEQPHQEAKKGKGKHIFVPNCFAAVTPEGAADSGDQGDQDAISENDGSGSETPVAAETPVAVVTAAVVTAESPPPVEFPAESGYASMVDGLVQDARSSLTFDWVKRLKVMQKEGTPLACILDCADSCVRAMLTEFLSLQGSPSAAPPSPSELAVSKEVAKLHCDLSWTALWTLYGQQVQPSALTVLAVLPSSGTDEPCKTLLEKDWTASNWLSHHLEVSQKYTGTNEVNQAYERLAMDRLSAYGSTKRGRGRPPKHGGSGPKKQVPKPQLVDFVGLNDEQQREVDACYGAALDSVMMRVTHVPPSGGAVLGWSGSYSTTVNRSKTNDSVTYEVKDYTSNVFLLPRMTDPQATCVGVVTLRAGAAGPLAFGLGDTKHSQLVEWKEKHDWSRCVVYHHPEHHCMIVAGDGHATPSFHRQAAGRGFCRFRIFESGFVKMSKGALMDLFGEDGTSLFHPEGPRKSVKRKVVDCVGASESKKQMMDPPGLGDGSPRTPLGEGLQQAVGMLRV